MKEEMISKEEAANQVRQMGRMMALLYYHISRQMIAAVGTEQAQKIITAANYCGWKKYLPTARNE